MKTDIPRLDGYFLISLSLSLSLFVLIFFFSLYIYFFIPSFITLFSFDNTSVRKWRESMERRDEEQEEKRSVCLRAAKESIM